MFRSGNPVLSGKVFEDSVLADRSDTMTVQGTITKTILVLACVIATAAFVWTRSFAGEDVTPWIALGLIGGAVMALVIIFRRSAGPITTPLYAACEGLFLGAISAEFEMRYPGLVIQAVALTFGTMFSLLALYKAGIVRATEGFKAGIFAATAAIGLVYLVDIVLMFFHSRVPFIHETGLVGIGFSVFVVAIAALNLVLDFDFIEQGARMGAPKSMEWYGAFGLLVTLVWLYLEILRLLAKLQSRSSSSSRSSRIDA